MVATRRTLEWVEQGLVPDGLVRQGIRRLLKDRLRQLRAEDVEAAAALTESFVAQMDGADVAPVPALANAQHYEVPAAFFGAALGPHRKYSGCYWTDATVTLGEAEALALQLTCERAGLANGQRILELGCGWGSLTLWMASHFPDSQITAVSNSRSQRAYIESQAAERGLGNVRVLTCDMNEFAPEARFERIVSVEMFEHMRNWRLLFARVASWLVDDGRFFMHVFCHRSVPYAFVDEGEDDWMSRHFFSGGIMPSDDLPLRFQDALRLESRWRWDGTHYERTANAWLANLDANRAAVWPVFEQCYGREHAARWWERWRLFFMSCAELWGFNHGQEWWVSHYLFSPRRSRPA
ncbi:MAG TPA: cyclopropane-fatty-acyl-phospholipid synthase family protein [Steroidobacteraceae bacterium]|nr:cyclopropane-fatty-acyl-phospholipid synthase family protein [Steroidobacteraceae bacterium]